MNLSTLLKEDVIVIDETLGIFICTTNPHRNGLCGTHCWFDLRMNDKRMENDSMLISYITFGYHNRSKMEIASFNIIPTYCCAANVEGKYNRHQLAEFMFRYAADKISKCGVNTKDVTIPKGIIENITLNHPNLIHSPALKRFNMLKKRID